MLAYLALLVFLIGIILLWRANQSRKTSGLPAGKLVYSDTSRWLSQEEPLYDPATALTGKPDYLIRDGSQIIPVEVKTGRPPRAPYETHIYQLAAYCFLVERVLGVRPSYGLLHYTGESRVGRSFRIEYTHQLEQDLTRLLSEIRQQAKRQDLPRSHQSIGRCRACGFRELCNEKLE